MTDSNKQLVSFSQLGRITIGIVQAPSVLSTLNVAHFGAQVLAHIEAHPGLNLLLDFTNVNYLSSVVLTELIRIRHAVEESHGQLRLCGVIPSIREVFAITNLERLFSIHEESYLIDAKRFERSLEIAEQDAAWQDLTE